MIDNNKTFICCITPELFSFAYNKLLNAFEKEYGVIETILSDVNWEPPVSYVNEMGKNLHTNIIVFENNLRLLEFVELKKLCINIENETSLDDARLFNLNPGYISFDGMFLSSHKASPSRGREYLSDNIWQEKQYNFNSNKFVVNNNTFSEFNDHNRLSFFNTLIAFESAKRCTKIFSFNYNRDFVFAHNQPLNTDSVFQYGI